MVAIKTYGSLQMPKKIPPSFSPSFTSSEIEVRSRPRLSSPVLVAGLPGIGLVSKLAADNLVKSLAAKPFAVLYSPHFPNQVLALKSGKLKSFSMKFYHARAGKRDLVILKGDLQPLTVEGQYEVTAKVLEFYKSLGGRTVVAMAGFATNKRVEKPKIYCSSTSKKFLEELVALGCVVGQQVVPIVGMAGMLPALAKLYGLRGACLLVETPGMVADGNGATHLTQLLSKMVGSKLATSNLEKQAKKAAKLIEQFEKQAQAAAEASFAGAKARPEETSYIR